MKTVKLITESSYQYDIKEEEQGLFIEGIFSTAEVMNNNGRRYPKKVLEREIDKIMESVKNKTCFGELAHPECFSSSAKILTTEGWKYFEDVKNDEKIYTLNPKTEIVEEYQITKKHKSFYKGKMISFKGENINTMVTPNHRMYVHDEYDNHYFVTAQSILDDRNRFNKYYIPQTAELIGINKYTNNDIFLDEKFLKVEEVDFEDYVYCVTVPPNETIYIMDNDKCFWSGNSPELNLDRVAILTTNLCWEGDNVIGKAKVLTKTPMGNIASVLIKEGNLGISSRGLGTVNESDNYVNEDFNLLRWDLVGDPSNPGSWVKGIYEGKTFTIPSEEEDGSKIVVPFITIEEARKAYKRHIWQVLEQIGREI